MKDSFIVYHDIMEVISELSDEDVGRLFRGIVEYSAEQKEPKFTGVLKFVFIPIKQQLDRNVEKYEKRCEKNRQNIQSYWNETKGKDADTNEYERIQSNTNVFNEKRSYTIATDTDTDTDTDTERDKDTESTTVDIPSLSSSVLASLNELAGTNFNTNETTIQLFVKLAALGYTEDQMKLVIEKKCDEWLGDPKMEGYLRPQTLFKLSNFENYLNQPDSVRQKKKLKDAEAKQKQKDDQIKLKAALSDLESVRSELAALGKVKDDETFERRGKLKERECIILGLIQRLGGVVS